MSDLERAPLRKASLSSISHSSYIHFSRRNVLTAAAGLWFLFSLYPVYLYLSDTTSATSASDVRSPIAVPRPWTNMSLNSSPGTPPAVLDCDHFISPHSSLCARHREQLGRIINWRRFAAD